MNTQAVSGKSTNGLTLFFSLLTWAILATLAVLAIVELEPPRPVTATAPPSQFSAERALAHVRVISYTAHPLGSSANTVVREYLVAQLSVLGMNPQILQAVGVYDGPRMIIGNTHDIVGRLPGSANSRAIMLVAHYDSVNNGSGAGDDGAAVGAILETVRALRAGPALKNDLIVLFTDGEEFGMLGADAFASAHPWFKDVGLMMNFEARGDQGPSLLFETSPRNAPLITGVLESAPHPIGSSLFYSLYKLLPNYTDFTAFRQYGISGLNFAFGGNLQAYHSRLDTVANLSAASLQHHGSYALSLTQYFGQRDLTQLQGNGDDVFFDLLGSSFIAYSEAWVLPEEILVTVLLGCTILLAVRRSEVKMFRVLLALLPSITFLLVIPSVLDAAWWLVVNALKGRLIMSDSEANLFLLISLILGGVCTGILLLTVYSRRFRTYELSLAGLIIVGVLSWGIALALPGASYLLFWPLLLMLVGMLGIRSTKWADRARAQGLASLAGTVITVLLFAPIGYLLYIFLTLELTTIAAIGFLLGLFFILCIPLLEMTTSRGNWLPTIVVFLVCAVTSVAIGARLSHHDAEHPRRDTIVYSLNADDNTALWITYDFSPDNWTEQFFSKGMHQRQPMPNYLAGSQRPELAAPAFKLDLLPPIAEIKAHEKDGDTHKIRINVRSQRNAPVLLMTFEKDVRPVLVKIGRREIVPKQNSSSFRLVLLGVEASGIDLELALQSSSGISFWLADTSSGLPLGVRPRSDDFMADEGSDIMVVCRKYSL